MHANAFLLFSSTTTSIFRAIERPATACGDCILCDSKNAVYRRNFFQIYSNNSYEDSMKQFWEMFDPEGWSLWICRYKYNAENTRLFMTSNLVGGFIQRSGEIRKWLFG